MSPTLKKAATRSGEHKFGEPFENRAAEVLDWLVELYMFRKAIYYLICRTTAAERIFSISAL